MRRLEACLKSRLLADPLCIGKRVLSPAAVLRIDTLSADVYAPLDVLSQHPLLVRAQRLPWHDMDISIAPQVHS